MQDLSRCSEFGSFADSNESIWEPLQATHKLNYFQPKPEKPSEVRASENTRGTSGIQWNNIRMRE